MFGSNKFGQLGVGDYKPRRGIVAVTSLVGQRVNKVACGDRFSVAATEGRDLCQILDYILSIYLNVLNVNSVHNIVQSLMMDLLHCPS